MPQVEEIFQMLIAQQTNHNSRLTAYRLILNIADTQSDNDFVKANLFLGHFYTGLYGNPIPQNCPIPSLSLAEPRYINVCSKNPAHLEARVALAHLYCRVIFNAYIGNNDPHVESYRKKLFEHLYNMRLYYLNKPPYCKDFFETLHNVLTSKNCDLKLSQNKCNLIWLLTTKYYLMANHLDYEMAKKCLNQFKPVTDEDRFSELMVVILEKIGFYESRSSEHLGQYVKNICGNFIKTILPPQILIKKAQFYQKESKAELAYWYVELATTALENNFYKNTTDTFDKKNEIITKLKEAYALFPEVHNIKHILIHILRLENFEQLHEVLIIEYPLSLPLHKAILSESIARYIKANSSQQETIIALVYKSLMNIKSLFPEKNLVDIFAEMSIDIQKYHQRPIQNDIHLVWAALAHHLAQQGIAANNGDVLKCVRRGLEMGNTDYRKILITLELCKKYLAQQHKDEFVHLLTQIALKTYDPATGKNLDIKQQAIDTILELKTTDELLALSEKCKQNANAKEELWYAEIAVRGLYKIKLPKNDKYRLEIFKKIESIARNYPASRYMKDKSCWARTGISSQAMIAKAARKAKKDADNNHHINNDSCGMIEGHSSTMKSAQR